MKFLLSFIFWYFITCTRKYKSLQNSHCESHFFFLAARAKNKLISVFCLSAKLAGSTFKIPAAPQPFLPSPLHHPVLGHLPSHLDYRHGPLSPFKRTPRVILRTKVRYCHTSAQNPPKSWYFLTEPCMACLLHLPNLLLYSSFLSFQLQEALQVLEHTKYMPASGPLLLLLSVPGKFFLIKCQILSQAFPDSAI